MTQDSIDFQKKLEPELVDTFVRDGYVYDIYDGDTVYYHVNLGYNTWAAFQTGRLLDVWAPEIRPLATRREATLSRNYLRTLIRKLAINRHDERSVRSIGYKLRIQSVRGTNKWFENIPMTDKGKYGRWLVVLLGANDDGNLININEQMANSEYATEDP